MIMMVTMTMLAIVLMTTMLGMMLLSRGSGR